MIWLAFLAGICAALAAVAALLGRGPLPRLSRSMAAAVAGVAAIAGLALLGYARHDAASPRRAPAVDAGGGFADAAKTFEQSTPGSGAVATPGAGAGSMEAAIASLEARLARGGGSADDWELLAKSFDFLGRPEEARRARAHQLSAPPTPADAPSAANAAAAPGAAATSPTASSAAAVVLSGEVTLAAPLLARAHAGDTLFIIAKAVDSPGMPVAVLRERVGAWPLKFRLDDSQAMLPGRSLSSAGRLTVEARISKQGQPLPSPGDLQGSSAAFEPAAHPNLKILIDRVIP